MKSKLLLLLISIVISSCSTCNMDDRDTTKHYASDHSTSMATLYQYYAEEYQALAYQAFNIAHERVDAIRTEYPDRKDLAIVVDIDETLLDNSPHQALSIVTDSAYPYMWNEWCELEKAKAVPGAIEFLQYADEQGFNVFYVSNRKEIYVRTATMNNLRQIGFPQVTEKSIMLRLEPSAEYPNPSDKQMRRDRITSEGFEIVMLIGDNLGDFYSDEPASHARMDQMESFRNEFGHKFIILPNAMYGNWQRSHGISDEASMDSLLIEMTAPFN